MITQDQLKDAAAHASNSELPRREFRFYADDFTTEIASPCLTLTTFPSDGKSDMARLWAAACYCHSENLCRGFDEFRATLMQDFQVQSVGVAEFRRLVAHWIVKLNPELELAAAELHEASSRAHGAFSISSVTGLRSIAGLADDFVAILIWTEERKPNQIITAQRASRVAD